MKNKSKNSQEFSVEVDRELCIGAASCTIVAPSVFELDRDNKAVVLDPDSVNKETLIDAAESCPVRAIIIKNKQGQKVFPRD